LGEADSVSATTGDDGPPIGELLALSRSELERALDNYVAITEPEERAAVTGHVLDQNGYPVPGARIVLVPTHHWGKLPGAGDLSRNAASGADGAYRIEDIEHSGDFSISASKEGFATAADYIRIDSGKTATFDFALATGITLQGRVLSASGAPVPDALVNCLGVTGPRRLGPDQRRVTQTDAMGHFLLGFKEDEAGSVAALRVPSTFA
jgi:hypothetical protein